MTKSIFKDNANQFIIAFDFDGTCTPGNIYPHIHDQPRKYIKEVTNFLYNLGVIVIIWTCRDKHGDLGKDTFEEMVEWLGKHDVKYHAINSCIEYAPWAFESRKIYAHMYVDDRAFGWNNNDDTIILRVLFSFMTTVMRIPEMTSISVIQHIAMGWEVDLDAVKQYINSI